jgi:hypothetical protein
MAKKNRQHNGQEEQTTQWPREKVQQDKQTTIYTFIICSGNLTVPIPVRISMFKLETIKKAIFTTIF